MPTTTTTTEYYVVDEKGLKWSEPAHFEKAVEDLTQVRWFHANKRMFPVGPVGPAKTFYLTKKVTTTTYQTILMTDATIPEDMVNWE